MTVGAAVPELTPLKMSCTQTDCDKDLHCFLQTTRRPRPCGGPCRSCGKNLVDFERVHARDLADVAHTFEALSHEWIRHEFWHRSFDIKAMNHARRKGMRLIREEYAEKHLRQAVGKARHSREGQQTSYQGNVLCYAQHAVAACCRKCIDYWHGIPIGQALTDSEVEFLKQLVLLYLERRLPDLNEEPMKVPSVRQPKPQRPKLLKAGIQEALPPAKYG